MSHSASTPLSSDPFPPELTEQGWEQRYQEGRTQWDLGQPAPPFMALLESEAAPPIGRIAVLGAGRGHDALLFAEQGFDVVGFDFAPSAIAAANQLAESRQLTAQFLLRDIFELATEFSHGFDYVLEHTCYCAIAPQQRPAYVQLVHEILRPQGEFIGLFWAHDRKGGPPFGTTADEILQQFSTNFEVLSFTQPANSVSRRKDEEYLARFRAR